jgi:hypothetical protein
MAQIMSWIVESISTIFQAIIHLTKPRVSLEIMSPHLFPEWHGDIKGYRGEVMVTNKGRRIAYDLTARIEVERDGLYDHVLEVHVIKDRNNPKDAKTRIAKKESAYNVDSQWTDEKRRIVAGKVWKQLRKDDSAILMFPRKQPSILHVSHISVESPVETYAVNVLKLMAKADHRLKITVKGEDFERITVSKTKTFRFRIEEEEDGASVIMPS